MAVHTNLTQEQYEQLMKPLNPARVAKRQQAGRNLSYLETWDVKAHLIRIFGFGGWSWDVISVEQAFESEKDGKWNVGYRVAGRLMIPTLDCTYTEAAVGSATLPQRGEAHDMSVKTAESDALKRAAINLGTQFGLSLYNNGDTKDVVMKTLIVPTLGQQETEK
jgi:recombination DNA repair RAD52 pathway protein